MIGKRLPRVDALDKVAGKAIYSADVNLPGMLHGKVLRSPYPHGKIRRLDVTRAQALDGVMAVITAADAPRQRSEDEQLFSETCYLAKDKIFFAGQPVAAVAAINPDIAEEALGLIEVDYEELPYVMDAREAMKPEAPIVQPSLRTNLNIASQTGKTNIPSNIAWRVEYGRGDVEAGFREADVVLENTFRTQRVHQGYLEPRAAVASVDPEGKVTLWTDSQGIFAVRELCARFLGLPLSHIKVMPVEVGGAFGGKVPQPLSPLATLLARKTGRPVKMVMTREEVLVATYPAPASLITLKMGVSKEGHLTAASATLIYDSGAFPGPTPTSLAGSITGLSPYRIPNLEIKCYDVVTNKSPSGHYRGPSATQAAFAVESQIDLLARTLGMDPLDLRLRNAVAEGDPMPNGVPLPKIGFRETLERMQRYLAQRGKLEGERRGRGVACGFWRGGVGNCAAHVHLNGDGSVVLVVGSVDVSGSRTSLAQIAAEELGIPFEAVTVVTGDTQTAPYAEPATGSRTTHQMGIAVCRACQDARDQLARRAASRLGVEPNEVEFFHGCVRVKGMPEKAVSVAGLAQGSISLAGEGPIIGRGSVGMPQPVPMFAVHAADVEVDRETGKVKILSYAAAQDVGLAINPTIVEGQIQGAVSQGIGWALAEDYVFHEGVMQNATWLDYRMPTAADLPFVDPLLVEASSATGPFGIRGVGETSVIPSLAAIANAVHSAAGVRLKALPMTPETVFRALRAEDKSR